MSTLLDVRCTYTLTSRLEIIEEGGYKDIAWMQLPSWFVVQGGRRQNVGGMENTGGTIITTNVPGISILTTEWLLCTFHAQNAQNNQ